MSFHALKIFTQLLYMYVVKSYELTTVLRDQLNLYRYDSNKEIATTVATMARLRNLLCISLDKSLYTDGLTVIDASTFY